MKDMVIAFLFAVQFLTRIPVRLSGDIRDATTAKALMLFPVVGWLVGTILFLTWQLVSLGGRLEALSAAALIVAAETILTGAFHLDGLADSCDALFSTHTDRERKLAIMKDSRTGAMGAVALVLALLLKTVLVGELLRGGIPLALIVYPVVGRWFQVALYVCSPYIRPGGIGAVFSNNAGPGALVVASLLALPCFAVVLFPAGLLLLGLFFYFFRRSMQRRIGGITGDVLGAGTVLSEIICLIGIIAFRI